jgi:hypothetical protein
MSRPLKACFLCFLILAGEIFSQGQTSDRHVYLVVVQVAGRPNGILQTGFRLRGMKGIVTALHGVVGEKTISAWNERQSVFSNLVVSRVDIPDDLALLTSPELQSASDEGLESGRSETILQGESLTAWGHPVGIRFNKKPVKVGDPPEEPLGNLIPPSSELAFERRKSPDAAIRIIYLSEGNLVPGHSGAPLLAADNRVVGVVDGGLLGGIAAISWAVPLSTITWQDATSVRNQLADLARQGSSDLFAFDAAPPRYFAGIPQCQTRTLDTVPFTCAAGNLLLEVQWAQFNQQGGNSVPNRSYSFIPLANGFRIAGAFAVRGHLFSNVVFDGRIGLKITTMDGSPIGNTKVLENDVVSSPVFTETPNGRNQLVGPSSFISVGPMSASDQTASYNYRIYNQSDPVSRQGSISAKGPVDVLWNIRLGGLCYQPADDISISLASIDFVVGN